MSKYAKIFLVWVASVLCGICLGLYLINKSCDEYNQKMILSFPSCWRKNYREISSTDMQNRVRKLVILPYCDSELSLEQTELFFSLFPNKIEAAKILLEKKTNVNH